MSDRDDGEVYHDQPLVIDLYCGAGGVGAALDELPVRHIGIDVDDYSGTYPGEFIQADASRPPLDLDADLVWASPPCQAYSSLSATYHGSAEAARDEHPTIPELNVREVCQSLTADDGHYIIENVKRCDDLRNPTEINGFGVGLSLSNLRLFETSFPVPDAVSDGSGAADAGGPTSESVALREAKRLPTWITGNDINQAIPPRMVRYLLHYCPSVPDVDLPGDGPRQTRLTDRLVTDGGEIPGDGTDNGDECYESWKANIESELTAFEGHGPPTAQQLWHLARSESESAASWIDDMPCNQQAIKTARGDILTALVALEMAEDELAGDGDD